MIEGFFDDYTDVMMAFDRLSKGTHTAQVLNVHWIGRTINDAIEWCRQEFGKSASDLNWDKESAVWRYTFDPDARWIYSRGLFRFKHDVDAFQFKITWCG